MMMMMMMIRLSEMLKKILKRKLIVGIRNYKQSHFPSEISSWLWPSVWSYSNNKDCHVLSGERADSKETLSSEDQSYFNNLYFRFSVIPCLTDGPRIVTEGSHSCHLVNVDPIRLLLLVQLLLPPAFISSTWLLFMWVLGSGTRDPAGQTTLLLKILAETWERTTK